MHRSRVLILASIVAAGAAISAGSAGAADTPPLPDAAKSPLNPQPLPPLQSGRTQLNPQPLPPLQAGRLGTIDGSVHGSATIKPYVPTPPESVPHPVGPGPHKAPMGGTATSPAGSAGGSTVGRSALSNVLQSSQSSGAGAGK